MLKRTAVAALLGIALGLAARLVDDLALRWVGNVGALWFLIAFVVGRLSRRRAYGARLGAACLATAAFTYYLWRVVVDGTISTGYLVTVGVFWFVAAFVSGAIAGWFGARSHRSVHLWGIPAGVFVGEAISVAILSKRWIQVAAELCVAIVCFAAARRAPRTALTVMLFSAIPTFVIALIYRSFLA
ncbi:MAG TPA: DUF6518 family protein [Actinomycetota bacterium]|nr:DUF6518 family protein [Actinomycetota bacterium]